MGCKNGARLSAAPRHVRNRASCKTVSFVFRLRDLCDEALTFAANARDVWKRGSRFQLPPPPHPTPPYDVAQKIAHKNRYNTALERDQLCYQFSSKAGNPPLSSALRPSPAPFPVFFSRGSRGVLQSLSQNRATRSCLRNREEPNARRIFSEAWN